MLHPYQTYPIMDQLSTEEFEQLHHEIQERQYIADQLIMKHGAVSEHVHIIVSGQASVFIEHQTRVELALSQRGHFFGEMSCLTGDPNHFGLLCHLLVCIQGCATPLIPTHIKNALQPLVVSNR